MSRGQYYEQYFVALPQGLGWPTCGHQHKTPEQARNCGGNAYRVTRKQDPDSKPDEQGRRNVVVSFREVQE